MAKIFNLGNHNTNGKGCNNISPLIDPQKPDIDPTCGGQEDIACNDGRRAIGGSWANCDPLTTGNIVNDPENPNRNVIYRYSGGLRGTYEAMQDMFKNLVVIDPDGKVFPVPLFPGSQEKAVLWVMSENVRKDNSGVVDRPVLPLAAIAETGMSPDQSRFTYHHARYTPRYTDGKPLSYQELRERDVAYTVSRGCPYNISYSLYLWTYYQEDMNQLLTQVLTKFSYEAYIKVQGVDWEVPVKLESCSNNVDTEPGDQGSRVIKYQIDMTAESYIPQPIMRNKTVLNIKTDYFNAIDPDQMHTVYGRNETK